MSAVDPKRVARRFYEDVLNAGNLTVAREIIAADYTDHGRPPNMPGGLEGFKQLYAMIASVFPDIRVTMQDMIAEGDKVAVRLTVTGTQKGSFRGFPPTGRRASWTGMDLLRIAEGKIVERWSERDFLGILQQVGLVAPPESRGS